MTARRSSTRSLRRVGSDKRLIILALCDSASCFVCHKRSVNFRCRLDRRFTGDLKIGLQVRMTGGMPRLVQGLLGNRKSVVTCGVPVAGRLGSDLVCYNRRMVARRMVIRQAGKGAGPLGSMARLIKGGVCIGPNGCCRQLIGLGGRLKKNVLVRRMAGSDVATRSLVARITRNGVPCAITSGSITGLGTACCPGLGADLSVDFSRHTS